MPAKNARKKVTGKKRKPRPTAQSRKSPKPPKKKSKKIAVSLPARAAMKKAKEKSKKTPKKTSKKKPQKKSKKPSPPRKSAKNLSPRTAPKRKVLGRADRSELPFNPSERGGPDTGGQSGDTQGLSGIAETDSESVKELIEEGQAYEAEVVEGVESVPDADRGEVHMREVPEDDVPEEYLDEDAQK